MKYSSVLLLFVIAFFSSSCFNYEVQEEGAYSDSDLNNGFTDLKIEIAFAAAGDVYMMDRFGTEITRIYDEGDVEIVSISPDQKKILYKPSGENVKIYDVESESPEGELPDTENARWFDYHPNSETAFVVQGSNIKTFGPLVFSSDIVNLQSVLGTNGFTTVNSATLLDNGTIVFSHQPTGLANYSIALSNETTLLEDIDTFEKIVYLRANLAGDRVWSGSENTTELLRFRIPSLDDLPSDSFSDFGVPTFNGDGIKVNGDQIIIQGTDLVNPDKGLITSIDF